MRRRRREPEHGPFGSSARHALPGCDRARHRSADAGGRRARRQGVRRRNPAQVGPLAGHRRDQPRDREPAVPRRSLHAQRVLRTAWRGPSCAAACLFLSTHEPCSLCLSAITWAGFDNFHYLFGYVDTRDAFNIPHDLRILSEVFRIENGDYARETRILEQPVHRRPHGTQSDDLKGRISRLSRSMTSSRPCTRRQRGTVTSR